MVATLLIAFAALWLTAVGTNINSRMENAALYEKRKEIYDMAIYQIGMALFHPDEGKIQFDNFLDAKQESFLFFGTEVVDQLDEVTRFVGNLYNQQNKYKNNIPSDDFSGYLRESHIIGDNLRKKINPYFEISARKP